MPDSSSDSLALPVRTDGVGRPTEATPKWLEQLADQLDDTIALIDDELNHDVGISQPSNLENGINGSGGSSFAMDDFDWAATATDR